MRTRAAIATVLLAVMCASGRGSLASAETNMLPTPGFHHLHLNSVDPDAAIDFYTQAVPEHLADDAGAACRRSQSPNNVLLLFTKVATPPPTTAAVGDLAFRLARHRRAQVARNLQEPAGRQAPAALHHGRRRLRSDQQRHVAGHRRRARD